MNKLRLAVTSLALGAVIFLSFTPFQSEGKPLDNTTLTSADVRLSAPLSIPSTSVNQQDELGKMIQSWIDALSVQQGFEAWKTSVWNRYPLGPGTHGWIVLLKQGTQEIGYIVVSATPEGSWVMTEYGTGSNPLFSLNTLYRSFVQLELIPDSYDSTSFPTSVPVTIERLYHSPLHAVWQVKTAVDGPNGTLYLDATTGEQLPLSADSFNNMHLHRTVDLPADPTTLRMQQATVLPSFDPFHNTYWSHGKPLDIKNFAQLQISLEKDTSITYVADLFNKRVLAPFAVTGYTQWSGLDSPFIRLEQEGSRYIPIQELFENGFFFP